MQNRGGTPNRPNLHNVSIKQAELPLVIHSRDGQVHYFRNGVLIGLCMDEDGNAIYPPSSSSSFIEENFTVEELYWKLKRELS